MDQKKTHLPVLNRQTKDEPALQQRLVGVKVHGKRNYAFLVDSTVPGGGNLMIHILREVLIDLDSRNELPNQNPTMYLQVDNCGENKNKVLFAFLVDLVRRNIFAKVKVGFLMTGHTHEDIDSFFSTIASKMRSGIVCADLESFRAAVESAFQENDKPHIVFINAVDVFDYKSLYTPLIDKNIAYHQEPHQFRIKRFDSDTVLLHYKQWCQSKHWLPMDTEKLNVTFNAEHLHDDAGTEPRSATTSPEKKKPRTMTRWTTTSGQRVHKARLALSLGDSTLSCSDHDPVDSSINDISENLSQAYCSDREDGVFEPETNVETYIPGIEWISISPNLSSVQHMHFTECTIIQNHALAANFFSDIENKFALVLPEFFTPQVMLNWKSWMVKQQQLWDPLVYQQNPSFSSEMPLPRPYPIRAAAKPPTSTTLIPDSAQEDLPDDTQIITFHSKLHGSFTKQQRLDLVRQRLSNVPECSNTAIIVEGKGCIFKYTHVKRGTEEEITQIGVGIIEKVHGDASSPTALVDIRFCPPKGAKPQKGSRPDTLYQDINSDMCFNLHYRSRTGKKVENEDRKLEREVLLAFNLDINKSSGAFNKKNRGGKYEMSSYMLASDVIELFKSSK